MASSSSPFNKNIVLAIFLTLWGHIAIISQGDDVVETSLPASSLTLSSLPRGTVNSMPCLKGLTPCKDYLKIDSPYVPTNSCCLPLKSMIYTDYKCLCDIYNNDKLLSFLNITQTDAMMIPQSCGIVIHINVCESIAVANSLAYSPSPSGQSYTIGEFKPEISQANGAAQSGFVADFLGLIIVSLFL